MCVKGSKTAYTCAQSKLDMGRVPDGRMDAPIHCFPTMHPKRLRYQAHSTIEKILTITYVYWEALELGTRMLNGVWGYQQL